MHANGTSLDSRSQSSGSSPDPSPLDSVFSALGLDAQMWLTSPGVIIHLVIAISDTGKVRVSRGVGGTEPTSIM